MERGEEESARLARARLRARHQVALADPDRHRVLLHRRRLLEILRLDVRLPQYGAVRDGM